MHCPLWRVAVAERSMEPALRPGDWLLAWRGLRSGRPPRVRPGQVVLAWHPGRPGFLLIKRAARAQDGGWWLESDNRAVAAVDSRSFGVVPPGQIAGRMLLRYRRGAPDTTAPPAR
jgi:nickel-type superoxide dismutase maturation protease